MDDDTTQSIEHGRRIRACLRQPESSPIPVSEQIILLVALISGVFDTVSLSQITQAKDVLRLIINDLPSDLCIRLENAESLSDEDRKNIISLCNKALSSINLDKGEPLSDIESEQL
jgi:F-type H+-transporting ATPase subunit alpha